MISRLARSVCLATMFMLPALGAHAQSGQPWFDAASKALERHDYPTAKEKLLSGLAVEPNRPDAMVNLANIYAMEKSFDEAKRLYDRALALAPENTLALNGRALLWLQDGNLDKAVEMFVAASKADPSNPTPVLNLGDTAFAGGDTTSARRYYDLVLQIDPWNGHAGSRVAEIQTATGEPDKGIATAEKILGHDKKNYEAMAAAGRAWAKKGEDLRAIDYLYRAARGMPRDAQVRFDLALSMQNTRQYTVAAETLLDALDIDDSNPLYHLQLGINYYLMRDPQSTVRAREEYAHALARNPSDPIRAVALYQIALIDDDQEKWDDALRGYKQSLTFSPENAPANNNLGLLLARRGRFQDAIPYYQRALKVAPDFSGARFNLGFALLRIGDTKAGRAELEKLQALPDADPFKQQAKDVLAAP